jgi:hypothetical protein
MSSKSKSAKGKAKAEPAPPVFTELAKVPASRPHIDGLEEKYVRKLLERNDDAASLARMLDEEAMTVADLLKRRRREQKAGADFVWAPAMRLQRMQLMASGQPVGEDMYAEHEVTADRPGSLAERLKKVAPLPRSAAVCAWTGHDHEENIYVCNGRTLVNLAGALTAFCGFHAKECVGDHSRPMHVVSPNADGLCFACYALAHDGRTPEVFENALLVPNIAFGAPANRHNPLAPPLYAAVARAQPVDAGTAGRVGTDDGAGSGDEADAGRRGGASERFTQGKYLERYLKLAREARARVAPPLPGDVDRALLGRKPPELTRRELFALAMEECVGGRGARAERCGHLRGRSALTPTPPIRTAPGAPRASKNRPS